MEVALMALTKMTPADRAIIFECLIAAARGPFFCDADVSILFGVDRSELLAIVSNIPQIDDSESNVRLAIGNSLNNLTGYPHGMGNEWNNWISVCPDEIDQLWTRWHAFQPPIVYESFDVFGPTCIGGRYYRVVSYQTRSGGQGAGCEVWHSGRWLFPLSGPGGPEIMAAVPASHEELRRAGVDCAPIASNYDPLSVECE
jgi:hypothetical protein